MAVISYKERVFEVPDEKLTVAEMFFKDAIKLYAKDRYPDMAVKEAVALTEEVFSVKANNDSLIGQKDKKEKNIDLPAIPAGYSCVIIFDESGEQLGFKVVPDENVGEINSKLSWILEEEFEVPTVPTFSDDSFPSADDDGYYEEE